MLVAEDNLVNQQVTSLTLRKLGYDCTVVANGKEAVAAWETGAYIAILMDCQMPEMDGYEAASAIRRREAAWQHIPIIAVTAHAMQGDREKCLLAGMDGYISKPMKSHELAAALGEALQASGGALDLGTVAKLRQLAEPGEPDPFPEIGRAFLQNADHRLEVARSATDGVVLGAQAHGLRGMAGTIGAGRLAELCAKLEQAVAGREPAGVRPQLAAAEQEYRRVRRAVEAQIGT